MEDLARAKVATREATAAVAALLHGGIGHFSWIPLHEDFDTGHFADEFVGCSFTMSLFLD